MKEIRFTKEEVERLSKYGFVFNPYMADVREIIKFCRCMDVETSRDYISNRYGGICKVCESNGSFEVNYYNLCLRDNDGFINMQNYSSLDLLLEAYSKAMKDLDDVCFGKYKDSPLAKNIFDYVDHLDIEKMAKRLVSAYFRDNEDEEDVDKIMLDLNEPIEFAVEQDLGIPSAFLTNASYEAVEMAVKDEVWETLFKKN